MCATIQLDIPCCSALHIVYFGISHTLLLCGSAYIRYDPMYTKETNYSTRGLVSDHGKCMFYDLGRTHQHWAIALFRHCHMAPQELCCMLSSYLQVVQDVLGRPYLVTPRVTKYARVRTDASLSGNTLKKGLDIVFEIIYKLPIRHSNTAIVYGIVQSTCTHSLEPSLASLAEPGVNLRGMSDMYGLSMIHIMVVSWHFAYSLTVMCCTSCRSGLDAIACPEPLCLFVVVIGTQNTSR